MGIIQINNELVIDYRARHWCKLPYPNHPRGCPNYGRRQSCPPEAPLITDFIDVGRQMWLLSVEFNLAEHMARMKSLHPHWTERQARCVLYWQASVNKRLREKCQQFVWGRNDTVYTLCPEAMGVNVIKTAQILGLPIKQKPDDLIYKIALAGYPPKGQLIL